MFFRSSVSRRLLVIGLTVSLGSIFAAEEEDGRYAAAGSNYKYLALGDSISFGYDPKVAPVSSDKYTGYPEVVADFKRWRKSGKLANASCPGESSTSFLVLGAPDYGCLSPGPEGQPGFKFSVGLHTMYPGTQAEFAVSELTRNKQIDLVTLSLGGNDLLLVARECATAPNFAACVSQKLPSTLAVYAQNLTQILTAIRVQAGYTGTLILMKSYVPNTDPLFLLAISELNKVMVQVGSNFGVKFADAFTAFQLASAWFGGDPCKAGLLVRLNATTCDVHPSPVGRGILAATVLLAEIKRD